MTYYVVLFRIDDQMDSWRVLPCRDRESGRWAAVNSKECAKEVRRDLRRRAMNFALNQPLLIIAQHRPHVHGPNGESGYLMGDFDN
jgi:hypothetical protein